MSDPTAKLGIVTVSDRASRGEYEDRGGPAIAEYYAEVLTSPYEPVARVVPDEQDVIERTLKELCDEEGCALIVTTGDPLEITTDTLLAFIDGRRIDLGNRQKSLYAKYQEKYRQLGMLE